MRLWVLKRQLVGIAFFAFIAAALAGVLIYYIFPRASCFDGKQNGDELGVDCGGSCSSECLLEEPKEPVLLWSRFFLVRDGVYDVGALLENINLHTGSPDFYYTFKLYDASNVLLEARTGRTHLLPNGKTFVYEPTLVTGSTRPARVDFAIDKLVWETVEPGEPLEVDITAKQFLGDPFPTVRVTLSNRALFEEPLIEISVLLERRDGNVYAVSRTFQENLASRTSRDVVFSWPTSSFETPENIVILLRRAQR